MRLAGMGAAGQNLQVVSVPSHCYMYWTESEFAVPFARTVNDTLAAYCAQAPDRLMFWAHALLNAPEAAAIELRRACTELGAEGLVAGGANFGGLEFDSPELDVVWKTLCDLDLPMFIHGYNQSVTWGKRARLDGQLRVGIAWQRGDVHRCRRARRRPRTSTSRCAWVSIIRWGHLNWAI